MVMANQWDFMLMRSINHARIKAKKERGQVNRERRRSTPKPFFFSLAV